MWDWDHLIYWWFNFWILILNIAYFQSSSLTVIWAAARNGFAVLDKSHSLTGDQEPKERDDEDGFHPQLWRYLLCWNGTGMLLLRDTYAVTLHPVWCPAEEKFGSGGFPIMIISNLWFSILLDDDPKVPLRDLVHWHVNHEAVVEARGDHRHAVAGGTVLRAWEHACQVQHVGRQLRSSKPPATARSEPSPGRRTPWGKFRGCSSKEAAPPTYNQWPLQIAMVKADFRAI